MHKTFEDLPLKNLKVLGEDEVYSFEIFRGLLEIPQKIQPKGAFIKHRQILEPFLTSHLSLIDKRSKKKEDIYLKDINI